MLCLNSRISLSLGIIVVQLVSIVKNITVPTRYYLEDASLSYWTYFHEGKQAPREPRQSMEESYIYFQT